MEKKPNVLVVEDNEVNQMVAVGYLEILGCRSHVVSDGQQAVDALRAGQYDLVLMDVQMPVMDGIEATRIIRSDASCHSGEDIPIVAMTGHALAGDRERFLAAGMTDYLSKPIMREDMERILNSAFAKNPF